MVIISAVYLLIFCFITDLLLVTALFRGRFPLHSAIFAFLGWLLPVFMLQSSVVS